MSRNLWRNVSSDGSSLTLRKPQFKLPNIINLPNNEFVSRGLIIDIETTGINHSVDAIIELGIIEFAYNTQSAEIVAIGRELSFLNDPGFPIPDITTRLTGITTQDVLGKQIDWEKISEIFKSAQLIVAHNAAFERSFLNSYFDTSGPTWSCSMIQVDWHSQGYYSKALESLSVHHGFFGEFHRALDDSRLTLAILLSNSNNKDKTNFSQLIKNAHNAYSKVFFSELKYDDRHIAREQGFRWNSHNKSWEKIIENDILESFLKSLHAKYKTVEYKVEVIPISIKDNFLWDPSYLAKI